jgi:hypothetical protein
MHSFLVALASAGSIFGGALLGMALQRRLPGHHLTKDMQDVVKLSAGTIATLTALVLGLLVSSAKTAFDTINTGVVQGSAKIILLDRTLARFGPEADGARQTLKQVVASGIQRTWPTEKTGVPTVANIERVNGIERLQDDVRALAPQTDVQREARSEAQQITRDLGQTRWLLIEEAQNELPTPLLLILVFWLSLLFVSFGLFAPQNVTALVVLFVGSCAISGSIFLVLELNQPLDGIIKVSGAPLMNALRHLGE